jgi:superoxide dismutase
VSTPNQDNPLMDGKPASSICSVSTCGHAYYLNYQKSTRRLHQGMVERRQLEGSRPFG